MLEVFELFDADMNGGLSSDEFYGDDELACDILNLDCSTDGAKFRLFREISGSIFTEISQDQLSEWVEDALEKKSPATDYYYQHNLMMLLEQPNFGQGMTTADLANSYVEVLNSLNTCQDLAN